MFFQNCLPEPPHFGHIPIHKSGLPLFGTGVTIPDSLQNEHGLKTYIDTQSTESS